MKKSKKGQESQKPRPHYGCGSCGHLGVYHRNGTCRPSTGVQCDCTQFEERSLQERWH